MTAPAWTPGPWELDGCAVFIPYLGPHHRAVAYCGTEANARLIASAPRLYEVLAWVANGITPGTEVRDVIDAALAEARGET